MLALIFVGTGQFYKLTAEGRTIGWGEEPLWFPHAAAKFAGSEGMPDRFLSFHNGLASLFEYYHSPERPGGPGRTVYTDPRLEITGAELFDSFLELGKSIAQDRPGWEDELDRIGRPVILVDHQGNAQIGASLMSSRHWKCVWFDPIVACFVHDSADRVVKAHTVDFGARHFRPDPSVEPHDIPALAAAAKGLWSYLPFLRGRPELALPVLWLGQDYARRVIEADPDSPLGWKTLGQIELLPITSTRPARGFACRLIPSSISHSCGPPTCFASPWTGRRTISSVSLVCNRPSWPDRWMRPCCRSPTGSPRFTPSIPTREQSSPRPTRPGRDFREARILAQGQLEEPGRSR